MANITLNVIDHLGNPVATDNFQVIASTNYNFSGTNTGTFTLPNYESFQVIIQEATFRDYQMIFTHYDYDIVITITLIPNICRDETFNYCCNASFFIIDNPCNQHKILYKTSSSPSKLKVYKGTQLIGEGGVIPIPDYLACSELTIVSEDLPSCCCAPVTYPPCTDTRTIEIACNECLCKPDWTFDHDACYDKIYPFIDFENQIFFKKERWYIPINEPVTFTLADICIRTELWVYNQSLNDYVLINYRPPISVDLELVNSDGDILATYSDSLSWNFTDTQLATFLANLILTYTFDTIGKYKLKATITTNCGNYVVEKEIYVMDDIELTITEICKEYELIICNDTFTITIRDYIKDETIVNISLVSGVANYVFQPAYTSYENKIVLEVNKLKLDIPDGIYTITIVNGLESKTFIVVHLCNLKECYLRLAKALYCEEEFASVHIGEMKNHVFLYHIVSFFMLYKLIMEYYTLQHPIHILDTTLSNSENLVYVEIDKALKKAMKICEECKPYLHLEDTFEDCNC